MINTRYYLDGRHKEPNKPQPLKLCITKKGASAYIPIGVSLLPSQWNRITQKVTDHPRKQFFNNFLSSRKVAIDNLILELTSSGKLSGLNAVQIKNIVMEHIDPEADSAKLFCSRFEAYGRSRRKQRTREIYAATLERLMEYDAKLRTLTFEMITKDWLNGFDEHLINIGNSKNTRNIHFRNIRAVFNDAIDNEITHSYPFRKFDMRPEETVKRSLTLDNLRLLLNHQCEPWQQRYIDFFKLTFLLIGINPVDLLNCKPHDYENGRLVYQRAKTGRWYNIKVEPEAAELIEKYRGGKFLVNFGESVSSYHTFVGKCNKGLKTIGTKTKVLNPKWKPGNGKHKYHVAYIPDFPELSIYWARHTWSTTAYSLDVTDEAIAASLGHGHGNRITAIYIDKSIAKVDEANRRVIDWVLYGKR